MVRLSYYDGAEVGQAAAILLDWLRGRGGGLARQQVAEHFVCVALDALGQFFRSPRLAHQLSRAFAVAGCQPHTREREFAPGAGRLVAGEATHGGCIAALLPQPRLGAPAQQRRTRPFRVGGDERGIAAEIRGRLGVAQDEPFDELLPRRISDPVSRGGRLVGLGLACEVDRFLDQR